MKLTRLQLLFFTFIFFTTLLMAQEFSISGVVKNAENNEPLVGANVFIKALKLGAITNSQGEYRIDRVPSGTYSVTVSLLGYTTQTQSINVNRDLTLNFNLRVAPIQSREVIVEVNRARERETPVAFSNVDYRQIEKKIHGQDAPFLVKGTPGVFSYSTDGVGNGEGKLLVRGFSQEYVQVLINGVPTNDPESNAVYWSNWGSVSANAASIQVQRGAGSSLYGAGAFGGSFNIITGDASLKPFYGLNLSLGSPQNTMYGLRLNTGLLWNKLALSVNIDRKIAEGSRVSGRYEGVNYYFSASYIPFEDHNLKLVLHGAPQEHGYSFSNHIGFFKKYGFKANSAPFLPKSVVENLPVNKTTGAANYGLLDGSRELVDDNYVNLSHNFFHKPQLELHYSWNISPLSQLNATAFYSMGRGAGSSMNSTGTVFALRTDTKNGYDTLTTPLSYLNTDGVINDTATAINVYLKNAFQRISYSFHQQGGIIANYTSQLTPWVKATIGGEARYWTADHPGHFTNLFGKTSITQTYAYIDTAGKVKTFGRYVSQGDLKGPESDVGNIFKWGLADNDPTYKTQYRNYRGETPQFTLFAQGNWLFDKLNVMTSLQYVWYQYKLTENMPSENAVGRQLTPSEVAALGLTDEGPRGDKFYMKEQKSATDPTAKNWFEYKLVNEKRSRGFLQPKVGLNYNLTENANVFANFAHVERFVDLGIYYNQGRVNPDVGDEKSNQFEFGAGWASDWLRTKANGYMMFWENKSSRIQDITKAGQPGYDRNGFRSELVGTSRHLGVEFEFDLNLDKFLPVKGFGLRGMLTYMNNVWTKILDEVLIDPDPAKNVVFNGVTLQEDLNLNGKLDPGEDVNGDNKLNDNRRVFNASGIDGTGATDAMYFIELKDKHVASGPQTLASLGITFNYGDLFAALDWTHFSRNYLLDGDGYLPVDGDWGTVGNKEVFYSKFDTKLPAANIFDFTTGYRFSYNFLKGFVSLQVLNIFNTEYLAAADRYGVIPGYLRAFRFNVSIGI